MYKAIFYNIDNPKEIHYTGYFNTKRAAKLKVSSFAKEFKVTNVWKKDWLNDEYFNGRGNGKFNKNSTYHGAVLRLEVG